MGKAVHDLRRVLLEVERMRKDVLSPADACEVVRDPERTASAGRGVVPLEDAILGRDGRGGETRTTYLFSLDVLRDVDAELGLQIGEPSRNGGDVVVERRPESAQHEPVAAPPRGGPPGGRPPRLGRGLHGLRGVPVAGAPGGPTGAAAGSGRPLP